MKEAYKEMVCELSRQHVQKWERKGVLGKEKNSGKGTEKGLQPASSTYYIKAKYKKIDSKDLEYEAKSVQLGVTEIVEQRMTRSELSFNKDWFDISL